MKRLLFVLLLASAGCVHTVPLPASAEVVRAKTADGWEIELVRYRPVGPSRGLPVVLCHGIAANARNMDLDDEHSMARFVASRGREAWTMSLRGTGASGLPEASKGPASPISFDDYWRHDLPTVIDFVRQATGAPAVDFVGHSMGGLVLYAYLSQGGQGIHAAATMGSPTRLDWGQGFERPLLSVAPMVAQPHLAIPSSLGAHALAPFEGTSWDGPAERFFYNPLSTRAATWQRLMAYGTADIAGGVVNQLQSVLSSGAFRSADGRLDLRADLARITTPVIVVAGKLDRLAVTPASQGRVPRPRRPQGLAAHYPGERSAR